MFQDRSEKLETTLTKIVGDLTIKDVTKEVELDAELSGPVKARGETLAAFYATGSINRFEYGVQNIKIGIQQVSSIRKKFSASTVLYFDLPDL